MTIQEKTVTRDSFGGEVIVWAEVAEVWASVEPLRGDEFIEAQRAGAQLSTRIVMRYQAGIVPEMRVVYGTHTYDVLAVIHVEERGRELQLMCKELV